MSSKAPGPNDGLGRRIVRICRLAGALAAVGAFPTPAPAAACTGSGNGCVASCVAASGYSSDSFSYVARGPGRYEAVADFTAWYDIYVDGALVAYGRETGGGEFASAPGQVVVVQVGCVHFSAAAIAVEDQGSPP